MNPLRTVKDITKINDVSSIAKSLQEIGCLVFHEQNLTEKSYVNFMKSFGECEAPDLFMNLKEYPEIFLVTGKRDDDNKKIGMFGDTELGWHSNGNSRHLIDKIVVDKLESVLENLISKKKTFTFINLGNILAFVIAS